MGIQPLPNFWPISIAAKRLDASRRHLVWRYRPHSRRPSPPPKRGPSSQFSAHVYCGQMAAWITVPLGTEVGLIPSDFMLDVDPAPLPKRGQGLPPAFSTHFYCGQMARCIKMPLGMEVGLSPGDFVLDGDPAPPQFLAHFYCGQTAGCIKTPLGMEV